MHVRRTLVVTLGGGAVRELTVDDDGMTLQLEEDGARQLHTMLGKMLMPEAAEAAEIADDSTHEYIQKRTLRDWRITGISDSDLCAAATRAYAPDAKQIVPSVYVLGVNDAPLSFQMCEDLLRAAFWLQPRVRDYHYSGEVILWAIRPVKVVVRNTSRTHHVLVCSTSLYSTGIRLVDHLDVAAIHAGAGVFIPKFN